jgi:hypothetical protein
MRIHYSPQNMSIVTRKERVIWLSHKIEVEWEKYWWKNMIKLIREFNMENPGQTLSQSPHITKQRVQIQMDKAKQKLLDKEKQKLLDEPKDGEENEDGLDFIWDFDALYKRHVIDDEFVKMNDIDVELVGYTDTFKNLTFENMSTTLPEFDTWHPSDITAVMPIAEIEKHITDYDWSTKVLKRRSDVTLDFVIKHFNTLGIEFDEYVSENINVSLKDIKNHEAYWLDNIYWMSYIKYNPSITREIVHEYFDDICKHLSYGTRPYNYGFLRVLTFEMYLYYIGETDKVHTTESLTEMLMCKKSYEVLNVRLNADSHFAYSFRMFQCHGDVNLSIIDKYPSINWNCGYLLMNSTNTLELYKKYDEQFMSCNFNVLQVAPNASFDYLIEKKERINETAYQYVHARYLLECDYVYEKQRFVDKSRREYLAGYRIYQWWMWVTSNPRNSVCHRKLEQEFDEFFPAVAVPHNTWV